MEATASAESASAEGVRPFTIDIPDEQIKDLRSRIEATRWPGKEIVADATQGVQLDTTQELIRYWGSDYDMSRLEDRLNAFPQFMTEIDGVEIHLIHVRSRHENALPLIITHGWPGSVIELLEIVGPLTDPTAHGASAGDAFDLVLPSLPATGSRRSPPRSAGIRVASHGLRPSPHRSQPIGQPWRCLRRP
jgi:Epoxide hydrolase N terminus